MAVTEEMIECTSKKDTKNYFLKNSVSVRLLYCTCWDDIMKWLQVFLIKN